ncbi:hypothetical protein VitviT2T_010403 [Vitis vinifera]|uniref:Uncharacterized protein n=1 Tax=Vitis vinifera TaxID=29760 RepID=A0ABY9C8E3_VITVI|nr:hypothetical protein VitviT2T_010403 [Vitis vinifera]
MKGPRKSMILGWIWCRGRFLQTNLFKVFGTILFQTQNTISITINKYKACSLIYYSLCLEICTTRKQEVVLTKELNELELQPHCPKVKRSKLVISSS